MCCVISTLKGPPLHTRQTKEYARSLEEEEQRKNNLHISFNKTAQPDNWKVISQGSLASCTESRYERAQST